MKVGFLIPVVLLGCVKPSATASPPAPPAPEPVDAGVVFSRATLDVEGNDGRLWGLDVELATSEPAREQGLMFRRSLSATEGMLFVFDKASPHTFWMKNTLIPLDMVFVAEGGRVLGVVSMAEPQTLTPRRVEGESLYVLEVAGGWCAEHGVARGARLRLGPLESLRGE